MARASEPELGRAHAHWSGGRRRLVTAAVAVAVVGLTFAFVLPRIAGYRDVWRVVSALS